MVRITLFGTMSLSVSDGPALPLAGRCARLLAYLALHRDRVVGRSELLEHVWGDRADRASASTFNTALWRLRTRLQSAGAACSELLLCDAQGGVTFNPVVPVVMDAAEFENHVAPALHQPQELFAQAHADRLAAGVELYRADLLLEHSDDWILRERERHRRLYLNSLGRLMEHATQAGQHRDAIAHGQAIIRCEPLREDVHCALMQSFVAAGQRALALLQFESCRALLRKELAIAPMPDTLSLYREIVDDALLSGAPARSDERGFREPAVGRCARTAPSICDNALQLHRASCVREAGVLYSLSEAHVSPNPSLASRREGPADRRMQGRAVHVEFESARQCLADADAHMRHGLLLLRG